MWNHARIWKVRGNLTKSRRGENVKLKDADQRSESSQSPLSSFQHQEEEEVHDENEYSQLACLLSCIIYCFNFASNLYIQINWRAFCSDLYPSSMKPKKVHRGCNSRIQERARCIFFFNAALLRDSCSHSMSEVTGDDAWWDYFPPHNNTKTTNHPKTKIQNQTKNERARCSNTNPQPTERCTCSVSVQQSIDFAPCCRCKLNRFYARLGHWWFFFSNAALHEDSCGSVRSESN